jgi:hypothetical protein
MMFDRLLDVVEETILRWDCPEISFGFSGNHEDFYMGLLKQNVATLNDR